MAPIEGQVPVPEQVAANIFAAIQDQNLQMEHALMRLGLSQVTVQEFINNGITSLQ